MFSLRRTSDAKGEIRRKQETHVSSSCHSGKKKRIPSGVVYGRRTLLVITGQPFYQTNAAGSIPSLARRVLRSGRPSYSLPGPFLPPPSLWSRSSSPLRHFCGSLFPTLTTRNTGCATQGCGSGETQGYRLHVRRRPPVLPHPVPGVRQGSRRFGQRCVRCRAVLGPCLDTASLLLLFPIAATFE